MDMSTSSMLMSGSATSNFMAASPAPSSIANLPLSNPLCNSDSCDAYETAHDASQVQISWASQFDYGLWVTYFYCLAIFILGMIYWSCKLAQHRIHLGESATTLEQKLVARYRHLAYRRAGGAVEQLFGMSLGTALIILFALMAACVGTFVQRPYYRLRSGFGSPPLGVRAGLMATALTPIIIALSGKFNLVTMATGISHERLNIFHRWAAYLCLIFGVIHTIPFIVAPLRDGGPAELHRQFYKPGAYEYTGVPPLALLVFLCFFSIPWIRHRLYEIWVHSHIAAAIIYLGLMFWHVNRELNSWYYLWATLSIWLLQLIGRAVIKLRTQRLIGHEVKLIEIDGELLQLSVTPPCDMKWTPGQHMFLRFPTIGLLENHPFTVASVYKSDKSILKFFVRPHNGITKKLMRMARVVHEPMLKAYLDGPYGGIGQDLSLAYETVILTAGGSGITAVLPLLVDLCAKIRRPTSVLEDVKLIWVVRNPHALKWIEDEVQEALATAPAGNVLIDLYVTTEEVEGNGDMAIGEPQQRQAGTNDRQVFLRKDEGIDQKKKHHDLGRGKHGRPNLSELIPVSIGSKRTFVAGCGPTGMKADLSNAVAACQRKVVKGEVQEVALHTETFGW
ncbi:MAG: hypothetical protein M1818_008309 [Claussenomyces sp. TS43310]|nr:MAG: hypothetical protein M1818_008309 [Claussenomyces sp. TS43310]